MTSCVRAVALYPELLGTYGDGGNVLVLQQRLRWRGLGCEVVTVPLSSPVPRGGDLYILGGGEDDAQIAALTALRSSPLVDAVEAGGQVLAVCAGLQLLGRSFSTASGNEHEGLGLLDVTTDRLVTRAVGEVTAAPELAGLPLLSGFENHAGRTVLGSTARPLARVVHGTGNGNDAAEGAVTDQVVATYLHGPVLARNPDLADLLLQRVLGMPLAPLDVPAHDRLREQLLG